MKLLTLILFVSVTIKADSIELLSDLDSQLLGINDNGTIVGQSCFDGCGTTIWQLNGQPIIKPILPYLLLPIAIDTVPIDLNNNDEILIWSFPDSWGLPNELFLPTYSIFSLTSPQGINKCQWNEHGFAGGLGEWCLIDDGVIEPLQIEDGYTSISDFSLWNGNGLRTTNNLGESIEPCTENCFGIAGYIDPVPEPGVWLLLANGLLFIIIWIKWRKG